jgi:hypothetical protein
MFVITSVVELTPQSLFSQMLFVHHNNFVCSPKIFESIVDLLHLSNGSWFSSHFSVFF